MKIRTQFLINIMAFSIIFAALGASVVVTQVQIAELNKQEVMAHEIQTGASDLSYISNNYFLYQSNSSIGLWQTKLSTISSNLAKLNSTIPLRQALVGKVSVDIENLKTVFAGIVSFLETAPTNASIHTLPIFQTQWNRLALQTQAFAFDSQQLSQAIGDQTSQVVLENTILTFALLFLFGAFFIVSFLITYRGILRSISKLKNGIRVIGSGNLDYTVEAGKKDEIADVSSSVNQMAINLKTVTASKMELEREIEERKKAEEALKVSEEKANDLIKYAPTGIYEIDYRVPKFKSVNDAMCRILGFTRQELLSMSPFALLDDESKIHFRDRIVKLLAGEKVDETVEFKVMPKDGRDIYAVLNVMFTYKDGKPDGALVVAHDVTERRKMQKKLEEYAKNLEGLVEERTKQLKNSERLAAIGATAGMVGHDIRNPLQAITSDVYLLRSEVSSLPEGEAKDNMTESLDGIGQNVQYVNKIVQDLQDFARPITPIVKETNLESLCEDILFKNGVPEKTDASCKVEKKVKKIVTDPELLKRILTNIVNNAVQAMPNGGKIALHAYDEVGDVVISVQDTGGGIPEGIRSKLFAPLFTTKSKGQGFGLAVVKRMTEALGGTVTFESEEGKGTKFIVRLPQQKQ